MKLNVDSPVFQFLGTFTDFIVLNFLFLITCIPILTTGSAISALFTVTMREARNEPGYIIRPYLKAFKENLKSGFLLTLLYTGMGAILGFNLVFWLQIKTLPGTIALVIIACCTFCYLLSLLYVFALNARFENSVRQTLKNSLFIALANPSQTIVILLICIVAGALLYVSKIFRVFLIIFGFAFLAYCASYPLIKVLGQYEQEN
ncbi:MAG: YesL family protein [Oliverpabstia sp.]